MRGVEAKEINSFESKEGEIDAEAGATGKKAATNK